AYLEVAEKLRAIAFDKTGTLTIGRPVVTDISASNNLSEKEVLSIAGSIESRSEHPIAEAIVRKAKEAEVALLRIERFEAMVGLGVKARLNGDIYFIGSRRLFLEKGIPLTQTQNEEVSRLENEGKTVLLLGNEHNLLGMLAVADKLRTDAEETVAILRRSGIKVVMLTGDNEGTAKAIAHQAGVDEYLAQLLPEDKVETVKKLKHRYGRVAMVGDGVNDAPAMAVSDIGIAMGAAGTDVAMETGDIVLMSDDLSKIPYALRLSQRSIKNIRQNIIASLAIVAFLIPAALIGWIGLLPGLLLNEISALVVIVNGLRLLK
ncbi:MAG: cation-translocating P-type ATPase, partial [Nitrospirae bacterium]|nr:cation-translocating P-type ATPase [Nitrospirota bacterium]